MSNALEALKVLATLTVGRAGRAPGNPLRAHGGRAEACGVLGSQRQRLVESPSTQGSRSMLARRAPVPAPAWPSSSSSSSVPSVPLPPIGRLRLAPMGLVGHELRQKVGCRAMRVVLGDVGRNFGGAPSSIGIAKVRRGAKRPEGVEGNQEVAELLVSLVDRAKTSCAPPDLHSVVRQVEPVLAHELCEHPRMV